MYNNNQFNNNGYSNGMRGNVGQPYNYGAYNQPQFNPYQPTNTNKIFVSGIDDVKSRYQPFNSDYFYLDNDKPIIYQKTVDYKGQFEVEEFDIVKRTPQISAKDESGTITPTYVEKAEFDRISSEIEHIKEQLSQVSKLGGSQSVTTTNTTGVSRVGQSN